MPLRVGASVGSAPCSSNSFIARQVAGFGSAQERRRAAAEHHVVAAIELGAIRRQALQHGVDVGAVLERMRATSRPVNRFSRTFGAGRFDFTIVLKSIAAYSAVRPV